MGALLSIGCLMGGVNREGGHTIQGSYWPGLAVCFM